MPTDISHLPHSPAWVIPYGPQDDRDAVTRWQAHLDAGRLGNNPPPAPDVLARRLATAALFDRLARARHAANREIGR